MIGFRWTSWGMKMIYNGYQKDMGNAIYHCTTLMIIQKFLDVLAFHVFQYPSWVLDLSSMSNKMLRQIWQFFDSFLIMNIHFSESSTVIRKWPDNLINIEPEFINGCSTEFPI